MKRQAKRQARARTGAEICRELMQYRSDVESVLLLQAFAELGSDIVREAKAGRVRNDRHLSGELLQRFDDLEVAVPHGPSSVWADTPDRMHPAEVLSIIGDRMGALAVGMPLPSKGVRKRFLAALERWPGNPDCGEELEDAAARLVTP